MKLKVLVVDDSQFIRRMVKDFLEEKGFEVHALERGEDVFNVEDLSSYHALLLDVVLPGIDGLTVCRKLRERQELAKLPILFITSLDKGEERIKFFEAGGNDYLLKPLDMKELLARVEVHVKVSLYTKELEEKNRALEELNQKLQRIALFDALTALPNRRFFDQELEKWENNYLRYGVYYAIVMIDLDRFKQYNDSFGHPEGDKLLHRLGQVFSEKVRKGDFVARFGGEEFVTLCAFTQQEEVMVVAERLRQVVEGLQIEHPGNPPYRVVTVSCGVCSRGQAKNRFDTLRRADMALYRAKRSGRNRVICWQDED